MGAPRTGPLSGARDPVGAARALATELLEPQAAEVDAATVPRSHLAALGAAGLCALGGPPELGGGSPQVMREVVEVLAAACPPTWFVWTQHAMPVRLLDASPNVALRAGLLPRLCTGEVLSGVAFSHLRRAEPMLTATPDSGGWRLRGSVPWLTGWGVIDEVCLGAVTPDAEVVFVRIPAQASPEFVPTPPLALAAMAATATIGATVRELYAPGESLVSVVPHEQWRRADAERNANAVPAVFGFTARAVAGLRTAASPEARDAAGRLEQRLDDVRERAYDLLDAEPPGERIEQRLATRAEATLLAVHATAAWVTSGSGRAMGLDAHAQRLARAALFMLVQAQTPPVQAALLREI